jgi:hypothetical protein
MPRGADQLDTDIYFERPEWQKQLQRLLSGHSFHFEHLLSARLRLPHG